MVTKRLASLRGVPWRPGGWVGVNICVEVGSYKPHPQLIHTAAPRYWQSVSMETPLAQPQCARGCLLQLYPHCKLSEL